jgi:hypothetical protein
MKAYYLIQTQTPTEISQAVRSLEGTSGPEECHPHSVFTLSTECQECVRNLQLAKYKI